jgi:ubiquitin C-terminal hydrolase
MNTSGVHLTRWGDDGNLDASAGVKAVGEEGNSSETSQDAKPHSPIDETFTTEVRVCLTCDSCKYRRSHTETYLHLSLEIGPPIGSIEEGIRAFFKPEKRDVKCEKCFCETASQTMEVTRLPCAMLFHLKRFIVDISPDYSNISYRKDQSPVTFSPVLEIDERSGVLGEVVATNEIILPQNSKYTLRSVVNHIGSSASCGHYTADAVKQGEWIRCNDDYVTKIPDSYTVENVASTAYMVLYELETV